MAPLEEKEIYTQDILHEFDDEYHTLANLRLMKDVTKESPIHVDPISAYR